MARILEHLLPINAASVLTVCLLASMTATGRQPTGDGANRQRRHRRRRHRLEGTGSRRLGDRRDDRSADALRAHRRHRRSRPLRRARPAEGNVSRVGPRLRARRLAKGRGRSGQDASICRPCRAELSRGRAVLPGRLLVRPADGCRTSANFPATPPAVSIPRSRARRQWLRQVKSGGCLACHALGTRATREIPASLGKFDSSTAAWGRRIQSGQAGQSMIGGINQLGTARADPFRRLDRPHRARRAAADAAAAQRHRAQRRHHRVGLGRSEGLPPRRGIDRSPQPTLNANGLIYGAAELSADYLPVLDPVHHTVSRVELTVRDPATPRTSPQMPQPSPYWGTRCGVDQPQQRPQSDVRRSGPRLDHVGRAASR